MEKTRVPILSTTIKMEATGTEGEYVIYGSYIFDDFKRDILQKSNNIKVLNDAQFSLRFLDPFNQPNSKVNLIVFINNITDSYPMTLLAQIHNFNDPALSKSAEHNIIFNKFRNRTYLEFNLTWFDLLKKKNGYINKSKQIQIDFEFQHTIENPKVVKVSWEQLLHPKEPVRVPRSAVQEI